MKKEKTILRGFSFSAWVALLLVAAISISATGCQKVSSQNVSSTASASSSGNRIMTDMAKRQVTVPQKIERVSVIHPIPGFMVWRLAPKTLVSVDKQFYQFDYFMTEKDQKTISGLPVTGEFHSGVNPEQIIAAKPQVVISLNKDPNLDTEQSAYSVPVFATSKDDLEQMGKSWKVIGNLLNKQKEADGIYTYWENTLKKVEKQVAKVPKSKRLKVYYAASVVTNTPGPKTIMYNTIRIAGGKTIMDTMSETGTNATSESLQLSLEQIYQYDPDVIICATAAGKNEIMSSAAWKDIAAVKNNRVYVPSKYYMLDSLQALLASEWVAKTLYPQQVKINMSSEIRAFYKEIYNNTETLTSEELSETN